MRIVLASCRDLPEPDHDEALVVAALRQAGADAEVLAWDDPAARFAEADLVVLRSTWNYHRHLEAFLAWAAEVDASRRRLLNPLPVVRWNAVKRYLADLEARGVATVPTTVVPRGTLDAARTLASILDATGHHGASEDLVIKPLVSAGSFLTRRFRRDEAADAGAFLAELTASRDAMVQPWMRAVETTGERSLLWIDGELTHVVRKSPRFHGGDESVTGPFTPSADERAFAERAIDAACEATGVPRGELLYARVDTVRDGEGVLRVMELEMLEPSLYFRQHPPALARFVSATLARVSKSHAQRT